VIKLLHRSEILFPAQRNAGLVKRAIKRDAVSLVVRDVRPRATTPDVRGQLRVVVPPWLRTLFDGSDAPRPFRQTRGVADALPPAGSVAAQNCNSAQNPGLAIPSSHC